MSITLRVKARFRIKVAHEEVDGTCLNNLVKTAELTDIQGLPMVSFTGPLCQNAEVACKHS